MKLADRWVTRGAVLAVLVLPLLWWVRTAFFDPDVEMLRPALCGDWVVHPDWEISYHPRQAFPPTVHRLAIPRDAWDRGPIAELTVMGSARVRVAGQLCAEVGEATAEDGTRLDWRRPVAVDLTSCAPPENLPDPLPDPLTLDILTQNDDGPSPLRVCWQGSSGLPATGHGAASGDGWWARTPGKGWRPSARVSRETSELLDKDFAWPGGPWGYWILLAGLALVALVGLLRSSDASRRRETPDSSKKAAWRRTAGRAAPWLALGLVIAVYAWNGLVYPWTVSRMDQPAHVERLVAAAQGKVLPPADSMFQAYQPPLYYALGGALISLSHPDLDPDFEDVDAEAMRPAQLLDAVVGIANAFLVWWVLCKFGPASIRARVLALSVAVLSPVAVTTQPMLGNESLAGAVCGAALVAGLLWVPGRRVGLAALAGLAAGLASLSKFTGLMPIAAVGVVVVARWLVGSQTDSPQTDGAGVEPEEPRQHLAPVVVWLLVIALLAGPFYLERWLDWGDPFIGNWSTELGYGGEAEPGYRTPGFFLRFGEVFFYAPERGMWSSLWDGLYVSTWGEVNDSFVPIRDDAVNAVQLVVLALAVVPTLAWLAGLLESIGRALRRRPGVDLGFVAVTSFTVSSVAVFTTRVPFHNTVKAIFLLSLLIPAAYFAALGYARMERGLGRARWLLDFATVVQMLLVLRLFLWQS